MAADGREILEHGVNPERVRCRRDHLQRATRQLALLMDAGVPLVAALDVLSQHGEDPRLQAVLNDLATRVSQGHTLSHSASRFSRVFSQIYLGMLRIGESSGSLSGKLNLLADWLERDDRISRRVVGALTYPLIVVIVSALLTLTVFYWVLPNFVSIFEQLKVPLPWLTLAVMSITRALRHPGFYLAAASAMGLAWLLFTQWVEDEEGQRQAWGVLVSIPLAGPIIHRLGLMRLSSSLALLMGSGVDLVTTLRLAGVASGSPLLVHDLRRVSEGIREGENLSRLIGQQPDLYGRFLVDFLKAGEESSDLPEMCARAAQQYDQDVNYRIDTLGPLLEPVLLFGIALVLGTIAVSIFLPLYSYLGTLM